MLHEDMKHIENPVTRESESLCVKHAKGFNFKSVEAVSGKECHATATVS